MLSQPHPHRPAHTSAGIQPRQIGCVIVNSSLFNPTPSLTAMIMK
jgi:hypothetical protein